MSNYVAAQGNSGVTETPIARAKNRHGEGYQADRTVDVAMTIAGHSVRNAAIIFLRGLAFSAAVCVSFGSLWGLSDQFRAGDLIVVAIWAHAEATR